MSSLISNFGKNHQKVSFFSFLGFYSNRRFNLFFNIWPYGSSTLGYSRIPFEFWIIGWSTEKTLFETMMTHSYSSEFKLIHLSQLIQAWARFLRVKSTPHSRHSDLFRIKRFRAFLQQWWNKFVNVIKNFPQPIQREL